MPKETKKETFKDPKAVDLEGKEITEERLDDKDLEDASGGGDLCLGGGRAAN